MNIEILFSVIYKRAVLRPIVVQPLLDALDPTHCKDAMHPAAEGACAGNGGNA